METDVEKPKRKVSNAELDNVKNYMLITFDYGTSFCMPYKDGIAFIASLENAEKASISGYSTTVITFEDGQLGYTSKIITQQQYREAKMQKLLGVENE